MNLESEQRNLKMPVIQEPRTGEHPSLGPTGSPPVTSNQIFLPPPPPPNPTQSLKIPAKERGTSPITDRVAYPQEINLLGFYETEKYFGIESLIP